MYVIVLFVIFFLNLLVFFFLFFFFSSRRRHTRCLSDWSSDVCSSDLVTCATARLCAMPIGRTFDVTKAHAVGDQHCRHFSPLLLRCFCRASIAGAIEARHRGSRAPAQDRKSTRLNSSHLGISYAVFCL